MLDAFGIAGILTLQYTRRPHGNATSTLRIELFPEGASSLGSLSTHQRHHGHRSFSGRLYDGRSRGQSALPVAIAALAMEARRGQLIIGTALAVLATTSCGS